MARWIVAGLVVLNVLLGVGVYLRFENKAMAQIGGGRADYATVAGYSNNTAIVYVMDSTTGNMVVIRADPVNQKSELVTRKNVAEDLRRMK